MVEINAPEYDCRRLDGIPEPQFTGYFRDGKRRVDYVLVMIESSWSRTEKTKMEYLAAAVNLGLHLEMEIGVLPAHRSLVFVKVHAPAELLEEYGEYQDVHKPFKNSHLEYMKDNVSLTGLIVPCNVIHYEKQWIKFIRREYPGPLNYSTFERSLIVYRILLSIPFGKPENYFGLYRMMTHNLVLAAYPLHDGPYFFVKRQDPSFINGRQALFLNWVGFKNLFKSQPLNLINEYLGSRMAFLFAFYEKINRFLLVLAVLSAPVTFLMWDGDYFDKVINDAACTKYTFDFSFWDYRYIWVLENRSYTIMEVRSSRHHTYDFWKGFRNWNEPVSHYDDLGRFSYYPYSFKKDETYRYWSYWGMKTARNWHYFFNITDHRYKRVRHYFFKTVHYADMPVCPSCRDFYTCPFSNMTDSCDQVRIKTALDSIFCIFFAVFVCVAGIVFYIMWKRYEKYLYWLWESNENDAERTLRPEYIVEHNESLLKGLKKCLGFSGKFMTRLALTTFVFVFYLFFCIPCLVAMKYAMYNFTIPPHWLNKYAYLLRIYLILAILGMTNALSIIILEKFGEKIAYKFVDYKNYRTEDDHEKSLVVKMYGFSFMFNFALIGFFAFIKGQIYTFPNDYLRWTLPLGLGMMNCGPLTCIDELFIIFVVTIISKLLFKAFLNLCRSRRTDYSQGQYSNRRVPCWEREYLLRDLNEDVIARKYNEIFIFQAYATLFVYVFPPVLGLVYMRNIWDIRKFANEILVCSKRPMTLKTWGLGSWQMVLFGLPYAAAITNGLTVALQSHLIDYSFFAMFASDTKYFVDYAMAFFNTSDYFYTYKRKYIWDYLSTLPHQEYQKARLDRDMSNLFLPDFCLFPGKWNRIVESYQLKRVKDMSYSPTPVKWYINWYQAGFFIIFVMCIVVTGLIIHLSFSTRPADVEETMALEDIVTRYKEADMIEAERGEERGGERTGERGGERGGEAGGQAAKKHDKKTV